MTPRHPPPSRFALPNPRRADPDGLVAVGGDLAPGTLLDAYRAGLFPMPVPNLEPMAWWSPDPRAVLRPQALRVSASLRRSRRRYALRMDTAFDAVVAACADPSRPHGWIDAAIAAAYGELHRLGWAHSVEAYDDAGRLVGGLYGVAVGGLFAGESMFHRARDASKAALVGLVERLDADALLDVQWLTPHLASLGAVELPREAYLAELAWAVARPEPAGLRADA